MANPKRFSLVLAGVLVLVLALTACGETATPLPAATSAAAITTLAAATTSASTTTAAATTSATVMTSAPAVASSATTTSSPATTSAPITTASKATTAAPTTIATTTVDELTTRSVATTALSAVTPAITSGGGNGTITNNLALPSIAGLEEIKLDQSILDYINHSVGDSLTKSNVKFVAFRYFGSNDDKATVDNNVDTALKGAGYKFLSLTPGQTKLDSSGSTPFGVYSKDGSPDLIVTVQDPQSSTSGLNATAEPGNPYPAGYDGFVNQLKSKKTIVGFVGATGYAALFGQVSGAMATVTARANNATPTTK